MRALMVSALILGAAASVGPAAATVYVPGQYKDGIYIRPHFADGAGQAPIDIMLLPPEMEAAKAKEALGPTMLDRAPVPQKRPQLPAS